MNKTLLSLLVAASLGACSSGGGSSSDATTSDPTAAGNDPITGLPAVGGSDGLATQDDPASVGEGGDGTGQAGGSEAPMREPSFGPAQLSQGNYEAVVTDVFGIFSGRAYGGDLFALPNYPALDNQSTIAGQGEGTTSQGDSCSNGGTAALSMDWSGARVVSYERRGAFVDCQFGELLIDGEIEKRSTDNLSIVSSGITVRDDGADRITFFSGGASYGDGNNYGGSNQAWWSASDLDYAYGSHNYTDFEITGATTRYETHVPFTHDLQGSFKLTYGGTGGGAVQVSTPVPFAHADQPDLNGGYDADAWNFQSGVLKLIADDGSSVTVEADNGEASSARVTLVYAGQTETFDKSWSDWDASLRSHERITR